MAVSCLLSFIMMCCGSFLWLVTLCNFNVLREVACNLTTTKGNVLSTVIDLSSGMHFINDAILSDKTEEVVFKNALAHTFNLSDPLGNATPWKISISESNVTRILFPSKVAASVVHLYNVVVEDLLIEENASIQDFRADFTTLTEVSPFVSKLCALDILWITHSELASFSFDELKNSSISLLYLVANKIEAVSSSPGLLCCQNLEEIFLSDNRIKQIDLSMFALMHNLKTIFLESNLLSDIIMSNVSTDLSVDVAANVFREPDEMALEFCSWHDYYIAKLETNSSIEETNFPNCTDYFASLLSIHLARNKLEKVNFRDFSLMNNLNSLDLSYNMLVNLSCIANEVPVRLSELFVSNNNIEEIYLTPFPILKALYLYDNNVKMLNMSNLPEDIDYLNLINNPLNCNTLPHMNGSILFPTFGPYTEC